jgi:hypothetical protein
MAAVWSLLTNLYRPIHVPKCFLDAYAFISVSTAQKPTTYFSTPHIAGTSVGEILNYKSSHSMFSAAPCLSGVHEAPSNTLYVGCFMPSHGCLLVQQQAKRKSCLLSEAYCKLNEDTLDFFFCAMPLEC